MEFPSISWGTQDKWEIFKLQSRNHGFDVGVLVLVSKEVPPGFAPPFAPLGRIMYFKDAVRDKIFPPLNLDYSVCFPPCVYACRVHMGSHVYLCVYVCHTECCHSFLDSFQMAAREDCFDETEGLEFLASELGLAAGDLPADGAEVAALVGYQKVKTNIPS